jgi:type II secretory pathway predicted ATPase ExeA
MLDVYRDYYRLTGEPFRLSPDHRFSLGHRSYANAKAYLDYALLQGEGFIAITGGPGTGKTTLISDILAGFEQTDMRVATLTSTQLESRDLLHMVAHAFDLHPEDRSKANLLLELERFLNQQSYRGHRTILIVDEAQSLSASALEELRLLANMQRKDQLLLQIFLVGQEKLLDLIRAPGMEQLQQRLVAASVLEPLDLDETVDYVEHRLCRVAWRGDPAINEDALRLIHRYSRGIPRRINMICNRLFLYGGMQDKHELVGEDARTVIEELHQEFLLPAKLPEGRIDLTGEDADTSSDGAETPVRSLPRGNTFAENTAAEATVRRPASGEGVETQVNRAKPRSGSRRAGTTAPREAKVRRNPTSGLDTESGSARVPGRSHRQAVGRANQAAAKSRTAAPPDSRQGEGRYRRMAAAGLFLLAGIVFAAIMLDTDLKDLLKTAGLVESHDSFKANLKTTGVHKAVKVLSEGEDPGTPDPQGERSGLSDSSQNEVASAELREAPPISAVGTGVMTSRPAGAPAEAQAPAQPVGPEPTGSVSKQDEGDNIVHSDNTDTESSGGVAETAAALPSTPVKAVTEVDETHARNDYEADSATIEAEYGKLRQVAGERFSQRRLQSDSEAEQVVSSPKSSAPVSSITTSNASLSRSSTVSGSSPRVPTPKPSTPKLSAPKVSGTGPVTPKVSSVPKVSESKKSAPGVSAPGVSAPKASQPKVTAPKVSQPKITVAKATPTRATPARASAKATRSLKQLRSALLEGQWTSRGKPASLLPSEITFCSSQGEDRIGCWSVPQNIGTKYGPALYKVETSMKGFSAGSFKLSYRTLVKLVDADATEDAKEKAASSPDGWQVSEHSMQCQLTKPDTVLCRDKKGVTRNYSRSESRRN